MTIHTVQGSNFFLRRILQNVGFLPPDARLLPLHDSVCNHTSVVLTLLPIFPALLNHLQRIQRLLNYLLGAQQSSTFSRSQGMAISNVEARVKRVVAEKLSVKEDEVMQPSMWPNLSQHCLREIRLLLPWLQQCS